MKIRCVLVADPKKPRDLRTGLNLTPRWHIGAPVPPELDPLAGVVGPLGGRLGDEDSSSQSDIVLLGRPVT